MSPPILESARFKTKKPDHEGGAGQDREGDEATDCVTCTGLTTTMLVTTSIAVQFRHVSVGIPLPSSFVVLVCQVTDNMLV
ncbi:hypothetical protein ACOMHN_043937 [Nucella lapillus]